MEQTASVITRSDIVGHRIELHELDTYKPTVVIFEPPVLSDADVEAYRPVVEAYQARSVKYIATLHPIPISPHLFQDVTADPGLREAACRDFYLTPIKCGHMPGFEYKGIPAYNYCGNHPRYRRYLRDTVYWFTQLGVDGIHIDDMGGHATSYGHGGCFCEHCMAGFSRYLEGAYTASELLEKGIREVRAFDYRERVLEVANTRQTYISALRRGEVPLQEDFQNFLLQSDAALFRSLKDFAEKLSGRRLLFSWDNCNFNPNRAVYFDFTDFFFAETNFGRMEELEGPRAESVLTYKFYEALGKPITPTAFPHSWTPVKERSLHHLVHHWIAFSYALGGNFIYVKKAWTLAVEKSSRWYMPKPESLAYLFDFVRDHAELFDGYEAVADVGVLYSHGAFRCSREPLESLCRELVERHVSFAMVLAGDDWLKSRLELRDLQSYPLTIVCQPDGLDEVQAEAVIQARKAGAICDWKPGDDLDLSLERLGEPAVAREGESRFWLFPRRKVGEDGVRLAVHIVIANYDAEKDRFESQREVAISVRSDLLGGSVGERARFFRPGADPVELAVEEVAGRLRVVLPELDLWGILLLS